MSNVDALLVAIDNLSSESMKLADDRGFLLEQIKDTFTEGEMNCACIWLNGQIKSRCFFHANIIKRFPDEVFE